MWVYDPASLEFLDVNVAAVAKYGYSRREFLSMTVKDIYPEEDRQQLESRHSRSEEKYLGEHRHRLKDGRIIDVEVNSRTIKIRGTKVVMVVVHDITGHKNVEKVLKEDELLLSSVGQMAKVGGWEFDAATGKGSWTEEVARIHELEPDFEINVEIGLNFYVPESRARIEKAVRESVESGKPFDLELEIITAKGNHRVIRTIGVPVEEGGRVVKVRGSFQDITEQVKTRRELQESEERFRNLYEAAPVGISNITPDGKFIRCNPALERIIGYTEPELQKLLIYEVTHPEDRAANETLMNEIAEGRIRTGSLEKRYIRKDGRIVWVRLVSSGVYDSGGQLLYSVSITEDVTDRKLADDKINRMNRIYAVLSEINETLIRVRDLKKLFEEACRIAVEVGKFKLAWIGTVDEKTGDVDPVSYSGDGGGYLELLDISISPEKPGSRGPVGVALREKRHVVRNDIEHDGVVLPWHTEALKRRFRSSAAFPLMNADRTYGVICFYSSEARFFDEQEVALLRELSSDISYSIENIELDEKHKELSKDRDRMFNYSLDMLSIIGFDSYLKQINPAWSKILGWTNEELLAKPFLEFIHPEDLGPTTEFAAGLARGKAVYSIENRCRCKNGTYKWLSWNCVPLVEEKMVFAVTRDITNQKQSQEQLLVRNAAIESSMSAIGLADMDGKVFYINAAFLNLWAYDHIHDVIGKDISEFSMSAERLQGAIATMKAGKGFFGESKGVKKDGTTFDFQISANIVKSERGEPICIMASFMDITERKRAEEKLNAAYEDLKHSEEKYRSLFEQSKDAIVMARRDGSMIDANPAAVDLLGFDSKDEFLRTNIRDIYAEPEDRKLLLEVLESDNHLKEHEFVLKRRNGELVTVSASITGVRDESSRLVSVLGILRDVTKQKNLETQLVQAQKLESLGTLAGGIAHDFNNILGIIAGYSAFLERRDPGPEKILRSTEAIQKATARGTALVRQLLTFARKGESVYERISINDVAEEIMRLLEETLPKTIEVVPDLETKLPSIAADSTQIHQVLLNLCVNARDAMPNGGTLKIRTGQLEGESLASKFPAVSPGKYVMLAVSDTGIGMDEETKKRMFDPFFTTKEVGKGTGLGLALVHSIVASHRGFVDVETQLDKGTTFYIFLPVKERKMENVETTEIAMQDVPGGNETVLLIEDEEMLRNLVRAVIESKGYNVLVASDGEEGIYLYKKWRKDIDVVISDLGLPKIPGDEVLRTIRSMDSKAKLIAASGFIEGDVRSKLLDLGVTHFIQKPYRLAEMMMTLRDVIDEKAE